MRATDYFENLIVDHIFRSRTWAKPTIGTHWFALFTTAPTDAGGGVELIQGANYQRNSLNLGDAVFTATQGGTAGNSTGTSGQTAPAPGYAWSIQVPRPTTIAAIGIFDAPSGGNLLCYELFTPPITVNPGDPVPAITTADFLFTFA